MVICFSWAEDDVSLRAVTYSVPVYLSPEAMTRGGSDGGLMLAFLGAEHQLGLPWGT